MAAYRGDAVRLSLVVVIVFAAPSFYWFLIRPVMQQRAQLATFFSKAELIEAGWRVRLCLTFSGLKTMLWARCIVFFGILIPLLDMIAGTDLASLLPPIPVTKTYQITPTQYVPIIVVPSIGFVTQKLRKVTTTPVGVPSENQIAAVIPDASAAVVVQKTEDIAASKAPPIVASGKD